MNSVEFLQKWFGSQCNGDWEHCFGIGISTMDNPGWHVSVELEETPLAGVAFSPVLEERTEEDWVCCRIKDGCFEGFGGVGNLMVGSMGSDPIVLSGVGNGSKDC